MVERGTATTNKTLTEVLAVVLLATALSGCGSAKSKTAYTLITEPQSGYQPIYDFISGAAKTVDMTMYQLSDRKAQGALKAAAKRGVKVRVLLDSDPEGGGGKKLNQAAYDDLKANGVEVKWAWSGTLWHQKSIIRDGNTAAIMTCNLYAPFYPVTRDYAVITHNTATASGMESTFDRDWNNTQSPPSKGAAPKGSELIWSPGAQPGLVNLIDSARPGTTLYAEDEQLDSPPIEKALISAARRGVTVNLTMTNSPSWASELATLAAGGVHVRLYQPRARIYIHSKALSVNNDTAYVGSANFTTEMTDQNRNVGIITTDRTVVDGITSTMAKDFAGATPYTAPTGAGARLSPSSKRVGARDYCLAGIEQLDEHMEVRISSSNAHT